MKNILILVPYFITSTALAYMDLNVTRGSQIIRYAKNETCVIPQKFNGAKYSAKDIENELELCRMDFYTTVGVCPKLHNTNPGLEIYGIPADLTKKSLEDKICDLPSEHRGGDKLAKYKLSTSCSYTPSILAYYHVSRIMGDILKVPPAVLRTMDVKTYKATPLKAMHTLAQGGTIAATWKSVINQLNNPTTDKRGPYLVTSDYKQTFGGLMKNAKGEAAWEDISNHAGGDQLERGKAFMKEQVYLDLINPALASQIIDQEWNQENVQRLHLMADASDMLVMDFMLRQEDRFNNIAYKLEVTGLTKDIQGELDIKSMDVKKATSPEELAKTMTEFQAKYPDAPAFAIKRMLLKDNDCGVAVENGVARTGIAEKLKMLENVRHMKKSTYDSLQKLNGYLNNSTQSGAYAKDFFIRETMMTAKDYAQFALNVKRLAEGMKALCQSQKLNLDLQLETHFTGSYKAGANNCNVE